MEGMYKGKYISIVVLLDDEIIRGYLRSRRVGASLGPRLAGE